MVHASGGSKMMSAARAALDGLGPQRPLLIAVTVLTSMGNEDLAELGIKSETPSRAAVLACGSPA